MVSAMRAYSAVMTIITCDGTRYYTGDPVFGHDYTERRIIRAAPVLG